MPQANPERNVPHVVQQTGNWFDRAIAKAREDGAFDDLPNTGKPLKLDQNAVPTEWDLAFSMLKNAGVAPLWMEMQQDADELGTRMEELARRTREFLSSQAEVLRHPAPRAEAKQRKSLWNRIFGQAASALDQRARFERDDLIRERDRARREYVELAGEQDALIVKYHQALPSGLWHLQRYRKSLDEHAADFDRAVPRIDDLLNGKPLDEAAIAR
jgi:hypothetical protein